MRSLSFLNLVSSLVIVLSLAACSAGSVPSPTTPESTPSPVVPTGTPTLEPTAETAIPDTGLCANPLMPVVNGATWTYTGSSNQDGTYRYQDVITEVREDGFTITSLYNDSQGYTQQWACKSEGLMALQIPGMAALAMQQLNANFQTSSIEGVILPREVAPGDQWSFSLDLSGTISTNGISALASGEAVYDMTAAGMESLTVPAGTFQAMRINGVMTINATATVSGLPLPVRVTLTTTSWYAPGVGMVRAVTDGELVGEPVNGLLELQSYQIP